MKKENASILNRFRSFRYAGEGIISFLHKEPNARIHALATGTTIALAFITKISKGEWLAIVLAIGLVWSAEMINTCLEKLIDFISPDFHPQIKFIKDVAAGAVLVTALVAVSVGLIVFIPHFL